MKRTLPLVAFLVVLAAFAGCRRPDPQPSPQPGVTTASPAATPLVEEPPLRVSTRMLDPFQFNLAQFNDLFMRSAVVQGWTGTNIWLRPVPRVEGSAIPAYVAVMIEMPGGAVMLYKADVSTWLLRRVPNENKCSWLSWVTTEKGDCATLTVYDKDAAVPPGLVSERFRFEPDVVVVDYHWVDGRYLFALLVYDEDMRDVRLVAVDTETKESREIVNTGGYPFLSEKGSLGIAPSLAWDPVTSVGYFAALGSIFAFDGKAGQGGLFLDGAGLFYFAEPVICPGGKLLSFQAVVQGGEGFYTVEADLSRSDFSVLRDRRIPFELATPDFIFTHHSFYFNGSWSLDFVTSGSARGLISLEDHESARQILCKVDDNALSLYQGAENEVVAMSVNGLKVYTLTNHRFDRGFPSQRWSAPDIRTSAYPDFKTPDGTIRTFLASFQRGDQTVWNFCQSAPIAARWVAAVGEGVASRSLRLIGRLRSYGRLVTTLVSEETVVLEGDMEALGNVIGRDVITLRRLGGMWLIDSIKAAEAIAEP